MSNDKLEQAFKQLEENIKSGKFEEYLKDILEKEKQAKEYVSHKEYFDWLTSFINKFKKHIYGTENFLYMNKDQFTTQDIKNEEYIGDPIFDFFDDVGKEQGLKVIEDYSWSFPDYKWYFKFNKQIYFMSKLIGQGTEYTVRESFEEVQEYLDLDFYFEKK